MQVGDIWTDENGNQYKVIDVVVEEQPDGSTVTVVRSVPVAE